ncbi:MAG: DUF2963 domain-containing protein [Lettuce witches'-broom phytoplasma]
MNNQNIIVETTGINGNKILQEYNKENKLIKEISYQPDGKTIDYIHEFAKINVYEK